MGKLMKYELYRRSKLLIIFGLVLLFLEGAAIYGLYQGGAWLILFIAMLGIMLFTAFIIPLLDAVVNYYSDFKNTHGYMLFLTPNTGYQIIGSKALFALLELLAAVCLVAVFYTANYFLALAFGYTQEIETLNMVFQQIPKYLGTSGGGVIAITMITGVLQYFNMIMMAMTAVTLSKTLLSRKSFNWLIALLFYFALSMGIHTVNGLVFSAFGFMKDIMIQAMTPDVLSFEIIKYMLVAIGLYIVWIGAGYTASSVLLNKRVDL